MENISREDFDRLIFFEQAKDQAENDIKKDPNDSGALTRWGGALLELAHFRQGPEAYEMIEEAVKHFEKALTIDSKKHETLWCLGNGLTSQGFLTTDHGAALEFFEKASDAFEKALQLDPGSEIYTKALEMTRKAPSLHAELQKQLQSQQGGLGGMTSRESGGRTSQNGSKTSEFWYDAAGWVILVGLGLVWVSLARVEQATAPNNLK